MNHDKVIQLLKDYRCYKFALRNVVAERGDLTEYTLPVVISERRRHSDAWDHVRYTRIVSMLEFAIDDVLSDDQRSVIMKKYIERNPMNINEIAQLTHRDRNTVSRWHKEAIRKLSKALMPLTSDEIEITNFDHMFNVGA